MTLKGLNSRWVIEGTGQKIEIHDQPAGFRVSIIRRPLYSIYNDYSVFLNSTVWTP